MDAAEFDFNTTQQQKKQTRKRQKLFTPRPDDFPARELDPLHLHLLAQTALNGVMHTKQYFMLDGRDDVRTQDWYRRRLEYLFHAELLIRLRPSTRENAPMLYRCSPAGGRVLHTAGLLDKDKIPRNIRNDSQNYYWKHSLMRGDFRVRYTRLLRERNLPLPDFKGPMLFSVNLKDRGREEIRKGESDDYFVSPAGRGFIVEVHRRADDWKLNLKTLTYLDFAMQGGASHLGVKDLNILIITDSPDRVQKLMRLIRARMAWFVNQDDYLKNYQNLARPMWVDPAGDCHSLLD